MKIFEDLESLNKAHIEALIPDAVVELSIAKMYTEKIKKTKEKLCTEIKKKKYLAETYGNRKDLHPELFSVYSGRIKAYEDVLELL